MPGFHARTVKISSATAMLRAPGIGAWSSTHATPRRMPPVAARLGFRRTGLQRQRVELAAHFAFQRLVDDLVLLDSGFAAKRYGDHRRGIMVAVAGEIADRHLGVGNACPD